MHKMRLTRSTICGILIITFGFWACKLEEPDLPIAEEALVPILKDVQLAESIVQQQNFLIQDSLVQRYYEVIYKTHQIQAEDLDSTLAILRREPAIMDRIYTKVLEELSKEEVQD